MKAEPDAFICNVGDMLEYISGGDFKSTRHRVVKPDASERYSCAFFAMPNHDAMVREPWNLRVIALQHFLEM